MSVSLSNIKEDDEILASKNALIAAENEAQSIKMIGEAMRKYPEFNEKYKLDVISEFAKQTGNTLILSMDDDGGTVKTIPVRR